MAHGNNNGGKTEVMEFPKEAVVKRTATPSTHTLTPSDRVSQPEQNFAEIAGFLQNDYPELDDIVRAICFDAPHLNNVGGFGRMAPTRLKELAIRGLRLQRFYCDVCCGNVLNIVIVVAAEYHNLGPFEDERIELTDLLEPRSEKLDFNGLKIMVREKMSSFLESPLAEVGTVTEATSVEVSSTPDDATKADTAKLPPKKPTTVSVLNGIAGTSRSATRIGAQVFEKTVRIDPEDKNGNTSIHFLAYCEVTGHAISDLWDLCGDIEATKLIVLTALLRAAQYELPIVSGGYPFSADCLKAAITEGELEYDLGFLYEQVEAKVSGFNRNADLT